MPSTTILDQSNISQQPTKPLQRALSGISFEMSKVEAAPDDVGDVRKVALLPGIAEEEEDVAKCECCGLCEECTPEYIRRVRDGFSGKVVCGLCGEAVKEEMEKNGGNREEALEEHMSDCMRFNRVDRAYPVLYQAEAMREILRKCSKSTAINPNNKGGNKSGIARSSSCIPAIARPVDDRALVK